MKRIGETALLSRRVFLLGTGAVLSVTGLAGCGSGGGGGEATRNGEIGIFQDGDPMTGVEAGRGFPGAPVFPQLAARDLDGQNAIFFGGRNPPGEPDRLLQSLYWQTTVSDGVRIIYDVWGLSAQIFFMATGAFLTLTWEIWARYCYVRSYSAEGVLLGGVVLQVGEETVTATQDLPENAPIVSNGPNYSGGGSIEGMDELESQQTNASNVVTPITAFFRDGAPLLSTAQRTALALSQSQCEMVGRSLRFLREVIFQGLKRRENPLPRRSIILPPGRAAGDDVIARYLGISLQTGILLFAPYRVAPNGLFYLIGNGSETNPGGTNGGLMRP